MGSADGNDGGSMFLPFGPEDPPVKDKRAVSADPNVPLNADPIRFSPTGPVLVDRERPQPRSGIPVWARRLQLVVFVILCVQLGMLLIALPWSEVWRQNSLIAERPMLRAIAHSYFTRGLVTGLGIVNLWLGIWEAVTYREP